MNPHQKLAEGLSGLLTREVRSLLRHLSEARPYLTAATYPAWTQIEHLSEENTDHAQRLTRLIEALDHGASAGTFDPEVATYHYMDLASLLPLVIDERKRQITSYEHVIELAEGHPKIIEGLNRLLDENRAILGKLEAFLRSIEAEADHPKPVAG